MACFSQTYLLDVSELSGPTRGSFPTGIVCVYKFKEFIAPVYSAEWLLRYPVSLGKGRVLLSF